jgi:hypothetical protein
LKVSSSEIVTASAGTPESAALETQSRNRRILGWRRHTNELRDLVTPDMHRPDEWNCRPTIAIASG